MSVAQSYRLRRVSVYGTAAGSGGSLLPIYLSLETYGGTAFAPAGAVIGERDQLLTAVGTPFEPPELHWRPADGTLAAAWRSYTVTALTGPTSPISNMFQVTCNLGDVIDVEYEFILSNGTNDVAQFQFTTPSVAIPAVILYPALDNSLGSTAAVGSLVPVGLPPAT